MIASEIESFVFKCTHCNERVIADVDQSGSEVVCKNCGHLIHVPKWIVIDEVSKEKIPKKLNIFERIVNRVTKGKYREYVDSPLVERQKNIDHLSGQCAKLINKFSDDYENICRDNKIKSSALRQSKIEKELSSYPIENLLNISGIGGARLDRIKGLGVNSFQDLFSDPNRLCQARGMSGGVGRDAVNYVRRIIREVCDNPCSPDLKSSAEQNLVCHLLRQHEMSDKLADILKYEGELKNLIKTYHRVGFIQNLLFSEAFDADSLLQIESQLYDLNKKILRSVEVSFVSFEDLTTDDYIRGVNLLETAFGATGGSLNTSIAASGTTVRLSSDLLEKIESTQLNTTHMKRCVLRRYQDFAAKFIVVNRHVAIGDEMGLGKTIQVLAVMSHLLDSVPKFRALVIVPASISVNWVREIDSKTDFLPHLIIGPQRMSILEQWKSAGGIAITSYSSFRNDQENYMQLGEIDMLIADEAQYIKNPSSGRSMAVKAMLPKARYAVVMTGTPVENHPGEFIHILNSLSHGVRELRALGDGNVWPSPPRFKSMASSLYLRRNKEDVLKELPELIDNIEWVTLSDAELRGHLHEMKICTHIMTLRQQLTTSNGKNSSKMIRVEQISKDYIDNGKNVVIFTYFKDVLDLLVEIFPNAGRIDGSVKSADRMILIDKFSSNPKGGEILICQINAAGIGLNMQAAQCVILVEPQFNPAIEYQAICRVHRMGQRSSVNVHRIIAESSIEESMLKLLERKRKYMDEYGKESGLKESSENAVSSADTDVVVQESVAMIENRLKSSSSAVW